MIFPSIRIEGAILSGDILDAIERGEKSFQTAKDFGLDPTAKVKEEIADAWAAARAYWTASQNKLERLREGATGTTETRNLWMTPLLGLLGYQPELAGRGEVVQGKNFAISHRDRARGDFPIHIMGWNDSLDKKRTDSGPRMSPHALVQEYLNLTEHLYALVTNGRLLRLLRDSSRLIKLSFIEFDLERMFTDELYADFAILYRLLHASRMPVRQEAANESIIEIYHQDALDSGSRIREGLSGAVEQSILRLANGFLANPANQPLRASIANNEADAGIFYQWLLRLIYRLLFLMVIEERDLVYPRDTERRLRDIYYRHYSIQRLRRLAEKRHFADKAYQDAWTSLKTTFRLYEDAKYGGKLGIAPLAGDLFGADAIGRLNDCELDNAVLLTCLRSLSLFTNPVTRQLMRVNYAALNVEEFGSVYEGLLEYDPHILDVEGRFEFRFIKGEGRSSSGSHYTPDELVQPLIKHSLDYLIADRLKEDNPESALLSLTVCDVACGSGHILLNAARRIATELAVLRTDEDQPSPAAFREAVRDVIRHCIYGVDINPLAVELCKVALWLEAHNPGEPLNFLDHRIKCGNAIVGLARQEELERGIPDEAFKTLPEDDKEIAAQLRKQNKAERKGVLQLNWDQVRDAEIPALHDELTVIEQLPETTPQEIAAKQQRYRDWEQGYHREHLRTLADIQVAQFFIPKDEENLKGVTTHDQYWGYLGGGVVLSEAARTARELAERKRFFHWFLEFPEVFEKGGFDCILGNPPFLGGTIIPSHYGRYFLNWLHTNYWPAKGRCDLVAFFFRRIFEILNLDGFQALISTNTLSQGDTRAGGLRVIIDQRGKIVFGISSTPWPGRAAVQVSLVSISKGEFNGECYLNGKRASEITSYLDGSVEMHDPFRLKKNEHQSFKGVEVYGKGFMLNTNEAESLINANRDNADVLMPFLNGDDVNSSPSQSPSRWVINFFDWSEEKARTYPECYKILEKRVKDERLSKSKEVASAPWWLYWRQRKDLYESLNKLARVLVINRHSKVATFSFLPKGIVYSDATVVLAIDDFLRYAVLNSAFHEQWSWKYGSTMGTGTLRYTPVRVYETFPFPGDSTDLESIGVTYHEHRHQLMLKMQLGLTKTYNLFHDPDLSPEAVEKASKRSAEIAAEAYQDILKLRDLHRQMDEAVLAAYGWHETSEKWGPAIDLRHDFYEVDYLPENDRIRYTIHPDARREILKRLLLLNHERYEEEVKQGMHAKKANKKNAARKKKATSTAQQSLL
ncbi:MAG: type IIL restriction-modification enzyme MmeI [Candidatus Thiodiazotropha sp.]